MIIKIYDSLYTMVKPIIYDVENLTDIKRSELVDKFNAMENDCFQDPPSWFFSKELDNKKRLQKEILVKGTDNDTKYLAIAEYTQDGKVIDAGGAMLQYADHLGFGKDKKQWWLNEVCRSYHHNKENKQTKSPITVVIKALYDMVCTAGGKELYLMIEINPEKGDPQILINIYEKKYGFTLQMKDEKPATVYKKYYYMKRECPQKGGRRKKRTRRRRRKTRRKKRTKKKARRKTRRRRKRKLKR